VCCGRRLAAGSLRPGESAAKFRAWAGGQFECYLQGVPGPKPPSDISSASDVVLIHGRTDDQKGLKVLRARPEGLELGEVRPLEHGKPLTGDVVKLEPRPDSPWLCDVKTELRVPSAGRPKAHVPLLERALADGPRGVPAHVGPAKVTTDAYRMNWDAIWKRKSQGELN
jgi:hypothetical protein